MRLQNTPEIAKINGYMEAMSCCLQGYNYVIWFSARGIELEENDLSSQILDEFAERASRSPGYETTPIVELQNLIQVGYPGAKPDFATMHECNHGPTWLTTRVNTFIARINPSDRFKNVDRSKKNNLIVRFWRNVSEYIDYENSRVFQYNPAFGIDDELWDFRIWGFTFAIVNLEQRKCLLMHGGASD